MFYCDSQTALGGFQASDKKSELLVSDNLLNFWFMYVNGTDTSCGCVISAKQLQHIIKGLQTVLRQPSFCFTGSWDSFSDEQQSSLHSLFSTETKVIDNAGAIVKNKTCKLSMIENNLISMLKIAIFHNPQNIWT